MSVLPMSVMGFQKKWIGCELYPFLFCLTLQSLLGKRACPIGLYRENAIAVESEAGDSLT